MEILTGFGRKVQAKTDPAILVISKAKRPEWKGISYLMANALIIGDSFPDKIKASLVRKRTKPSMRAMLLKTLM